jgi:hypothetical protein
MHLINDPPTLHQSRPQLSRISTFPKTACSIYFNDLTQSSKNISYSDVPRSIAACQEDDKLTLVIRFHDNLQRPNKLTDAEYTRFVRYSMRFFVEQSKLWRRSAQGAHKLVVPADRRIGIMTECHDDVGHKGTYATRALILERFWWPSMHQDIHCYSCRGYAFLFVLVYLSCSILWTTFPFGPYSPEAQPLLVIPIPVRSYLFPSNSIPSRPLPH